MKRLLFLICLPALLLSACGTASTPTIDPAQVQASALAAASTMVAQTLAAIPPTAAPTDTPLPSPTLEPSPTSLTLPTLANFPTAAPQATAGTSNCNGALSRPAGPRSANVKLVNQTKYEVTISLYLNLNKFGDCGYLSYVINGMQSVSLSNVLPFGCYSAYAFSQDPKHPFHGSAYACITGNDKTTFNIRHGAVVITGP